MDFSTGWLTYLPTYLPSFLPSCLLTYLPTYLPTYLLTCLLTYLPTYILIYFSAKSNLQDLQEKFCKILARKCPFSCKCCKLNLHKTCICTPIVSSQPHVGDDLQWKCNGFSARHKDHRGTFHTLLIMLWNEFDIAEIKTLWISHIEIWGTHFTSKFSVFSTMTGWITQMLFMLFFAYTAVYWTEHSWVRSALAYGHSNN